ncbi:class I SAM-dependent methyltransferase [Catellatospora chokoriensis]|uniref:Methyltransferase n=1 Tax=Catellatospora chokoriensis TaxID=310353 RepID=A0A8J3JZH4_9ACTN|nr:class I SAM-dependent methyltransferase [Catellatospora chokoriensis]GIF86599.1 methyltransferase [Catellatospora chokoriensis]
MTHATFADGDAYEAYVGRWSRPVAQAFLRRLAVPAGREWLDVGCGTGALTETVLAMADPAQVTGVDRSAAFVDLARARISDSRAAFQVGDARRLPLPEQSVDVAVSGLVLNFVPDPAQGVAEIARVLRPGGVAAAYVWDYAEGMAMMRHFWDAAAELDPASAAWDEGRRLSVCSPDALRALWTEAGLTAVAVESVKVPTVFADLDDYWEPFLGGQGSAPGYLRGRSDDHRAELRELLRSRLPAAPDGTIPLTARAWTVRGRTPPTP